MAITTEQIRNAIEEFLEEELREKEKKKFSRIDEIEQDLKKAKTDDQRIRHKNRKSKIEENLRKIKEEKYRLDIWLDENRVKQAKNVNFGTHIAKGTHSSSKGNDIEFRNHSYVLDKTLFGSQCVSTSDYLLDATCSAGFLPIARFLTKKIDDGYFLKDLLIIDHPALQGVFNSDPILSDQYQTEFRDALRGKAIATQTDARNKQLLWPNSADAIAEDDYICLIPLHPAALSHHVYRQIQDVRCDEKPKAVRTLYHETRKLDVAAEVHKKLAAYREAHGVPPLAIDLIELAYVKLGGEHPKNVSALTNKQKGMNYLLPALPPNYQKTQKPPLRTNDTSFFSSRLMHLCKEPKAQLEAVINARTSTWEVRETRKQALDSFAEQILIVAADLAQTPGWTDAYSRLSAAEKYWLDPENPAFSEPESIPADWQAQVAQNFAAWLQSWLRHRFPKIKSHFDDVEYQEWFRWFSRALKANPRQRRRTE